jgi:hypothetical protein
MLITITPNVSSLLRCFRDRNGIRQIPQKSNLLSGASRSWLTYRGGGASLSRNDGLGVTVCPYALRFFPCG